MVQVSEQVFETDGRVYALKRWESEPMQGFIRDRRDLVLMLSVSS
ncbi:hypothetical protein PIIN_10603 [Serendipita indica DSM 11827]|uniref:Uncharacterized protein n=1 Tax=Serendipita indica (strain DSM 11827) TaxID=1109443 RepID=G4TZ69_SERID|nr:hypothetical protein PIIN_10603 [Serendipita indica DSM 11827]